MYKNHKHLFKTKITEMFKKVCAYIAYYKQFGQVCESKRANSPELFSKIAKFRALCARNLWYYSMFCLKNQTVC